MLRISPQDGRVDVEKVRELSLKIRAARKWSQGKLAQRLGVKRKAIERIEQKIVDTAPQSLYDAMMKLGESDG